MMRGMAAASEKGRLAFDPRTKVYALLLVNIVMLTGSITGWSIYIRIVMACVPLALILTEKKYKTAVIYLLAYLFVIFGDTVVLPHMTGFFNLLFVLISAILGRFLPGIMMGSYVMTTTTVSEFIAGMERLHVSEKLTIPISVMFRYFPTLAEESGAINDAMKMRGISLGGKNHSLTTMLEYRLVPIMMSTVKIGDELSAASLTKGLGGEARRTNMCKIGFGLPDAVLFLLVTACFAGYLMW